MSGSCKPKSSCTGLIVGISVGCSVILILAIAIFLYKKMNKKAKKSKSNPE